MYVLNWSVSVSNIKMADFNVDFDNPAFDPEEAEDISDLPSPVLDPPLDDQLRIGNLGDNLQNLRDELQQSELEEQKKRLVGAFYTEVERRYRLRPNENIDYKQFEIDKDGKTLYWLRGDTRIRISSVKGAIRFRGLSTLAKEWGAGGTHAIRTQLGLTDYDSRIKSSLNSEAASKLKQTISNLPSSSDVDTTPLQDLFSVAKKTEEAVGSATEALTEEQDAALKTITDPPLDTSGLRASIRELRGLDKAIRNIRGELTNNLAKLSELDDRILREKKKLEEAEDLDEFSRRRVAERLRNFEDERGARLEAISTNREALRSQISRIRETINRVLNEDTTLAERIRTLFREQGITIVSILTAIGMTISTLVLALTGGSGSAPTPTPPSGKGGIKEWVKKHLKALGRILASLAAKAAAALPAIIGSIISWLLNFLSKMAGWLSENLWALVIAVGGVLYAVAHEWLTKQPKGQ